MVETILRMAFFVILAFLAARYCNKWFTDKQKTVVSRTRKKWKRLCKGESFDGRSIASQRLDSRRLFKLGRIISIPIVVLFTAYLSNFAFKLPSSEPEQWGQMGDFFGGMLNPILAFASFIALLYTIRIQSEELRLTRDEFKKSIAAQQRMAGEAERSRKQSLLLEDYQYASGVLRNKIKALDDQIRANLNLESDPGGGVAFIPNNLISLVGLINTNVFKPRKGLTNEELLSEGRIYVQRTLMFGYKNESKIRSAVDDYARAVFELHQIFELYSQCCFKLEIDVSKESVQIFDYKTANHHLLMAYIFVGVVEQVYQRGLFLPLFDCIAMKNFNTKLPVNKF